LLTISPSLLAELAKETGTPLKTVLNEENAKSLTCPDLQKRHYDEKTFRWELNDDEMANDKLSEGIRKFAIDAIKLEQMIKEKLEK